MATSSITRNFVVEGQDVDNFANSLDEAFKERDERRKNFKPEVRVVSEEEKKVILSRLFENVHKK
ncbi:MAG: hypothetical protein J6M39_04740 [Lachnospiraceae bacterium]|nr:hypothetical protein [Lachnospiraceae bacterium]